MIKMNYSFNTQLTFENGLTISFSIGEANYCSNKNNGNKPFSNPYVDCVKERLCNNCEVAVWDSNNKVLPIQQFIPEDQSNDGSLYAGWVMPDNLAIIIQNVKNFKAV